jgi:hypothetical protein
MWRCAVPRSDVPPKKDGDGEEKPDPGDLPEINPPYRDGPHARPPLEDPGDDAPRRQPDDRPPEDDRG